MSTLLINNRRYNCEPWELMNWDKLHAILRYDEQRRRSDRQSVDRLTAELLTKIAGVRRSLARRTDPDDRILVAECLVSYLPCELRRLENRPSDETRNLGQKANRDDNRLPPEDETDWEGSPIPMSRITASAWCRASDLYLHDKWRYAPLIAALLWPVAGNDCDRRIRRKAETLKRKPLAFFAACFDRIERAHRLFRKAYPLCYFKPSHRPAGHDTEQSTWCDLLAWTGHYVAGEIERTGQMKCPDFMDLVHSRLKMHG